VRIDLNDFSEVDSSGIEEFEGRRVFRRNGRDYGLEIDRSVKISDP
jgi:hypothetical protein